MFDPKQLFVCDFLNVSNFISLCMAEQSLTNPVFDRTVLALNHVNKRLELIDSLGGVLALDDCLASCIAFFDKHGVCGSQAHHVNFVLSSVELNFDNHLACFSTLLN